MGYGISCTNPSNELTFSSDGLTYGYIGKATLSSVTQPQAGVDGTPFLQTGFSTYTITWPGDILVALPAKAISVNSLSRLVNITQAGSTWTITVHNGDGTVDGQGFQNQASTEVFVFGRPTSVSGYGMALWDAAGSLSADLSRRPIPVKSRIQLAGGTTSWAMPGGMVKPLVIGWPADERQSGSPGPGPSKTNRFFLGGWWWDSANGLLKRSHYLDNRSVDDTQQGNLTTFLPIDAILIEGNALP